MIEVPVYPNGYPCKCSGNCSFSKAFEDAGKPLFIDYESHIKKGFIPTTAEEQAIDKFLKSTYCDNR